MVLAGLPRVMAGAILAHECMHAWLRLSGVTHMQPQLEEGLCQLMAALWLGSLPPAEEVLIHLPLLFHTFTYCLKIDDDGHFCLG